jgi:hypothetical protein
VLEDSSWFKKAHRRAAGQQEEVINKWEGLGGWGLRKSGRRDSGGSKRMKIRY